MRNNDNNRTGGKGPRKPREAASGKPRGAGDGKPRSFGGGKPGNKFGGPKRPFGDKAQGNERPRREPRPATRNDAPREQVTTEDTVEAGRIAKILARAGVASRRDAERMILDGRVSVNGAKIDTPAMVVSASDTITVDGKPIDPIERTRLWVYHKTAGLVTTNRDPEGRPTVFDRLPDDLPRVVSIGRLDINTEGLLLLTNDGGLARALELPSTGWLRRYRVRAHGSIDQAALDNLKDGIAVDGVLYGAIDATLDRVQGHNVWITMGLREGKNREIKNVLGHLGLDVNRLIRLSFGPFQLGDLPEGQVVEVKSRTLRDQLGEKLIAEAGLNFEAPMIDRKQAQPEKAYAREERPERGRRLSPEEKREAARDRLVTRPDRGERGGRFEKRDGDRKFDKRDGDRKFDKKEFGDKKQPAQRRNRATNVWMAPGAKPLGEKKTAENERRKADFAARPKRKPDGGKPGGGKSFGGKSGGGKPSGDKPRGGRGGPGADRRR